MLPSIYFRLFKPEPRRKNFTEKNICLTFDDGPDPNHTPKLLDLLLKYNIKASFFVVATFTEKNPMIIKRMVDEGHCIGLHSLEHKNNIWEFPFYTKYDFDESMRIMNKLGVKVNLYRPPWGLFNITTSKYMKIHGLKLFLWTVMAEDWRGHTTANIIAKKLLMRTNNGDIICLHDGRGENDAPKRTIEALEMILPTWINEGYKFIKADELYEY